MAVLGKCNDLCQNEWKFDLFSFCEALWVTPQVKKRNEKQDEEEPQDANRKEETGPGRGTR